MTEKSIKKGGKSLWKQMYVKGSVYKKENSIACNMEANA